MKNVFINKNINHNLGLFNPIYFSQSEGRFLIEQFYNIYAHIEKRIHNYENLKLDLQTELESNKTIKEDNQELSSRVASLSELDKKKVIQEARYKEVKGKYDSLIKTKDQIAEIENRIRELTKKIQPSINTLPFLMAFE